MSQADNFSISVLFLKKINFSVNMLMNGIKMFYCIFVYNNVNSPLICDVVKPTLIYKNKVPLFIIIIINIIY